MGGVDKEGCFGVAEGVRCGEMIGRMHGCLGVSVVKCLGGEHLVLQICIIGGFLKTRKLCKCHVLEVKT